MQKVLNFRQVVSVQVPLDDATAPGIGGGIADGAETAREFHRLESTLAQGQLEGI